MQSKLPPLPDESYDGDKQSTNVEFKRCTHSKVEFKNAELRCPCGASWVGTNLHDLYTHFKST